MLKFARNKLVTTYLHDPDTLVVRGVLDDDIYSFEIDAEVRLPDLVFTRVIGKWHRWTTPECPRALAHIHEAEGLCIDDNVEQKLQKGVGRKGCRHYATLLIECVKSIQETMRILEWKVASENHPDLTFADFIADTDRYRQANTPSIQIDAQQHEPCPLEATDRNSDISIPAPAKPLHKSQRSSRGFIVDLHAHSFPASKCASDSVEKIIQNARETGLDAICLTDHNFRWKNRDIEDLRQKHSFLILGGNEITTDQGHMIAFGLDRPMGNPGIVKLRDLHQAILDANGFLIVAHPFRGFLAFGVSKLGLTVKRAAERPLFHMVDAVEILNGKVTGEENGFAAQVAAHLKLPATGGSDAHAASEVGCYATEFEKSIQNEGELLEALKTGRYQAVSFRRGISEQQQTD